MPSPYIKKKIEDYDRTLNYCIEENEKRLKKFRETEQEILDLKTLIHSLKEIP